MSEFVRPKPSDLQPGDKVKQRSRGEGIVTKTTKRTLCIQFKASNCCYSFTKDTYLIELDGTTKVLEE